MAGRSGQHAATLADRMEQLINEAFNLSIFHRCKVYILVEHSNGVRTFKSVEQSSWPPPDAQLEEFYPGLERLSLHHLVRNRLTEEERKVLIQLSLYLIHLTDFWPHRGPQVHPDTSKTDTGWTSGVEEDRDADFGGQRS
ncbi:hypothetical protein BJX63DRAFT_438424 [Aspergillus granulosus]|uniref:Uncharacterized protein n=1 Tax=Aspergillus granulosus TaxID=176169 RepID=A0ABR4GTQ6_9EURO